MAKAKPTPENAEDALVMKLMAEVKTRKAEIAKVERPDYQTNMSFSFTETGNRNGDINLNVESDLKRLISIVAFLVNAKQEYDSAVQLLGIEDATKFTWNGYTPDQWIGDVKQRINKIQINAKRAKLDNLEKKLDVLVSPEQRRKLELELIAKELA